MRIWCFQHFEPEEAGLIGKWAAERAHEFHTVRLYKGEALPKLFKGDALVVMGGPMNVDEDAKYPWLAPEKELIAQHIKTGGRVFGVCLGGQLIARAMGAPVTKNARKEIGWHLVHFHPTARKSGPFKDFPETLTALQWHGDTFAIPSGARHVASSDVCAHQAFTIGREVIALQFHFEAEEKEVRDFVACFDDELAEGGPYVQKGEEIVAGLTPYAEPCKQALYQLLDRWAGSRG
ncbi:MAG TPA: type 1 glutamine amidotransferase [Opitutales bacterium]|nr:type 1 glutamine amidotransferase [Opitutales bacterium]